MSRRPTRVLVVEDEPKVARALHQGLTADGYEVVLARTGEDGFFAAAAESLDLVVLDVMLPGRSGFDVLAALRKRAIRVPVLVLTARDAVQDRVKGLDLGADDYLTKPFAFSELLARIRALLRRGRIDAEEMLAIGDLQLDPVARRVRRAGRDVELTAREFELLEYLLRNQGRVVSREMIAKDVWKETSRATPLDNVIDVHVARLRRKADNDPATRRIHTIRGVGFVAREADA